MRKISKYELNWQPVFYSSHKQEMERDREGYKSTPAMSCENCGIVTLNLEYSDQNEKDNLIDILTLCSSEELRDDLQKSNPDIDINSEIIKNWKENYLPDNHDFKNQFKNDELILLERFDILIKDKNWREIEILSGQIIDLIV